MDAIIQNQPHRILSHNRSRRRVVRMRRNKSKTHQNKAQLTRLDTLRNDLPYNPHKLRKLMGHTRCQSHCAHLHHTKDSIETIQKKVIALQNQLEDIRRMERIRRQLKNWKEFKLHCGNWRLIDLYEYLSRIKGRKYAQYFVSFEIFYTQWMDIYDADQKSFNQRFVSHIFDGNVLIHLDHNDLMIFGVCSKPDRREILMQIQIINKTQYKQQHPAIHVPTVPCAATMTSKTKINKTENIQIANFHNKQHAKKKDKKEKETVTRSDSVLPKRAAHRKRLSNTLPQRNTLQQYVASNTTTPPAQCITLIEDKTNPLQREVFVQTSAETAADIDSIDSELMDDEHAELLVQLEDIVNEEMVHLMSLYDQFVDFRHKWLGIENNGIISCPLSDRCPNDSNIPKTNADDQNNNGQNSNNGNTHHNRNNDSNNHDNKQNGSNNSGGSEEDEKDAPISQSNPCNHLNACSDCGLAWTQKCEQNKLFRGLILSLQSQHAHHMSFVQTLCKAIVHAKPNANKKPKSKNRRKPKTVNKTQSLKVKIPKTLTEDIIPQIIEESIPSHMVYPYLNKSITMQHNDRQLRMDQQKVVVDIDFHETKSNESLYCVMTRTQHQHYDWMLEEKVYTKAELRSVLGITTPPQSSRVPLQKVTVVSRANILKFLNVQSVNSIMRRCKWNTIPVFNITNNTKRMTLSIEQRKLNPMVERTLFNMNREDHLIPILVCDHKSHWVEHVVVVHIDLSDAHKPPLNNQNADDNKEAMPTQISTNAHMQVNIGISLRCDAHGIRITGIHVDKEKISEQHQVLHPHVCHCLDGFNSNIHDIRVGNPDTVENKMKDLKQKYSAYKEFIHCFINSDPETYGTFQHQAQVLLMNENGALSNYLKSMDFRRSFSTPLSSPDYCLHSTY